MPFATTRFGHRVRLSAGTWMVLVCLLALAPMVAFGLLSIWRLLDDAQSQSRATLERRAVVGAVAVASEIESIASRLEVMSLSKVALERNLPELHALAIRVVAADRRIASISLTDASGQQRMNSQRPWGDDLPVTVAKDNEPAVFKRGERVVSPLLTGRTSGTTLVRVAVPVMLDGQVAYALRATVRPEVLNAVLAEQRWPADWTGSVIDQNHRIIARTRDAARYVGTPATASLRDAIARGQRGVFEAETEDGTPVLSSVAAVPGTGWTLAVGLPRATVEAPGAAGASAVREVHAMQSALGQAQRDAQALVEARRDALTGLAGRTVFNAEALAALDRAAQQAQRGVALLFIDHDGFKQVNDSRGHEAGDAALREVGRVLRESARAEDVAGRWGGDEFVLCLSAPGAALPAVSADVAQRVRRGVQALGGGLGCSIGLACARHGETLASLVSRADQAMLRAKRAGKHQVVHAQLDALT